MKFFVDTADTNDIRELAETGLLDGVTTNPSLINKAGAIPGGGEGDLPRSCRAGVRRSGGARSCGDDARGGDPAEDRRQHHDQGAADDRRAQDLQGADQRGDDGQRHLVLHRQPGPARGEGGATFISPFVGRHDDIGFDGMQIISEIRTIYDNYDFQTQILVASVRHPVHVLQSAMIGADVMTAPPAVIRQLFKHPLTDRGLENFLADWAKTGQQIG
jgi:transaldolase